MIRPAATSSRKPSRILPTDELHEPNRKRYVFLRRRGAFRVQRVDHLASSYVHVFQDRTAHLRNVQDSSVTYRRGDARASEAYIYRRVGRNRDRRNLQLHLSNAAKTCRRDRGIPTGYSRRNGKDWSRRLRILVGCFCCL